MEKLIAMNLPQGYHIQKASDVIRDGVGIELLDRKDEVVAEVFRSDAAHSVIVNTFNNDIPLGIIETYINLAKDWLGSFEDGSPLSTAVIKVDGD
jgi:hypothetical protein